MEEKIFSIYSKFIDYNPDVNCIYMHESGIMFCKQSFNVDIFKYFNWFCLHCEKPSDVLVYPVGNNIFVSFLFNKK